MGYYSQGTGELTFDPPLAWGVYSGVGTNYAGDLGWDDISFEERVSTENTAEGELKRRVATGVRWTSDDSNKKYSIDEDMSALARILRGTGTRVSGYLVRVGEESPDIERYWIDENGNARSEQAEVRWPSDGTKFS